MSEMFYDINWGANQIESQTESQTESTSKKRKLNDDKKQFRFPFEQDDIHIYTVGNDIHFSSAITLESIQKVIKVTHELLHRNTQKSKTNKFTISFTIDSPGGSVLAILKFVDFINSAKKKYPNVEFVSIITGLAASAGTIMALAADRRLMTQNAYAMIHELSSGTQGKYQFMKSHASFITQLHNKLVDLYVTRTGNNREIIERLMSQETWFNAEQYKEHGFVTEIV